MELLGEQPQFADKCDWRKLQIVPMGFWYNFLQAQPQFADKCDVDKVDFWGDERLLCEFPEIAKRCDWSRLAGMTECKIILRHPEYADMCKWDNLVRSDWEYLLSKAPQYRGYCKHEEILASIDNKDKNSEIEGWQMALQSANDSSAADTFDLSKLDGEAWRIFFRDAPGLAAKYEDDWRDWLKMSGRDWILILDERPDKASMCDWWKVREDALAELLAESPEYIDTCDLSLMNGEGWAYLLCEQPTLKDRCADWWKLNGKDWVKLLSKHPDTGFAEHCAWFKLDEDDWDSLLKRCPQFADKCVEMGFDVPECAESKDESAGEDFFKRYKTFKDNASGETWISLGDDDEDCEDEEEISPDQDSDDEDDDDDGEVDDDDGDYLGLKEMAKNPKSPCGTQDELNDILKGLGVVIDESFDLGKN